ncbi:DUF7014 domain-containing protein [Shewanella pneumatophori]|uniref:DUF7014 domain-containing protein n=1 Tax=Shewanella pneumatophori TaxID=314092 RepID=A0A9X2CGL4_9GAMM|nr:hypothetical protein [Shewanella pneumatophori]MCL1139126.1 hypothetical protein [Shewanella pneumatophori]
MFNFEVFSRRPKKDKVKLKALTKTFRNRVFMLIQRQEHGISTQALLNEIHSMMMMNLGKVIGSAESRGYFNDYSAAMLEYMWSCEDDYFFDALEYIFQTQAGRVLLQYNSFIDEINQFLDIDELPYKLTYGNVETIEVENDSDDSVTSGFARVLKYDVTYPKIIRKDSEAIDQTAIEPVLTLLRGKEFSAANKEFLSGLEDYRHGKYRESVTKCCSAFESVMKVVCQQRKIKLKGNETVGPLIAKVIEHTDLDKFFDQPLMLIGTIRNKLGISHGSGVEEKHVSEHVALYSINATASAILLVTRV